MAVRPQVHVIAVGISRRDHHCDGARQHLVPSTPVHKLARVSYLTTRSSGDTLCTSQVGALGMMGQRGLFVVCREQALA
jgi:hypothetical protein